MDEDIEIPESLYAYFYLLNPNKDLSISDLIPLVKSLNLDSKVTSAFLFCSSIWSIVKKISAGYEDFKKKINNAGKEKQIESYMNLFQNGLGKIYEFDIFSFLIYSIIKDFQNKTKKQLVLCIEDLDRLDPIHVFRILNVLSAHIDRQYIYNSRSADYFEVFQKNKFGFAKTILVCDHRKLEYIFIHFYGKNANFEGYMSKFSSCPPFEYSFRGIVFDHLVDSIHSIIPFNKNILKSLLNERKHLSKIKDINARYCKFVLTDIEREIKDETVEFDDIKYEAKDLPMVQVLAIFKRLGYNINLTSDLLKLFSVW